MSQAHDLSPVLTADPAWLLVEEGFNLAREHEIESLFTVANGYVGTRGSLPEGTALSAPATYVAGLFDRALQSGSVPELIVLPDWTRVRVAVDGRELRLDQGEILEHRRVLDLRQGLLWREWRHRDAAGRITRVRLLRLASLADRHVLLQSTTIAPENYSGQLGLESRVDRPSGAARTSDGDWVEVAAARGPTNVFRLRSAHNGLTAALAVASHFVAQGGEYAADVDHEVERGDGWVAQCREWEAEIGTTRRLDQLAAVYTARGVERPAEAAAWRLEQLKQEGLEPTIEAHAAAWESRWQAADVEVEGDEAAQRALRFASYHLVSAANPEDERVSIGAGALTGPAYKGHVFWDTEIYMLPFFVFTHPASARTLLMYRYHTLPAARNKAQALGYRGALYAWESADSGEETTPATVVAPSGEVIRILTGEQEHHISADVAYAVWQYWQASGDDRFFLEAGAEIMVETARFWASRGQFEADGRYHVRHVIGPDEYHEDVDDNAYTNVMAQWTLERGAEAAKVLAERWPERWRELSGRLKLTADEPEEWLRVAAAMETGFQPETGLFEQFRGYFDLEEIDLAAYANRTAPMDVLLGRERTQRSKVIKQADVALLMYLLWDRFPPEVREANLQYYEPRTGHGSSICPAIYALLAARLGDVALAERHFRQAAEIDLANNMGNAAGGVHMAAQGGLWQAVVFGFAGLQPGSDGLTFDPHLPPHWRSLCFPLQWRKHWLQVVLGGEPATIEVHLEGEAPMAVALAGRAAATLSPGRHYRAAWNDSGWGPWEEST